MYLTTANIRNRPDMPRQFVRADAYAASRLGRGRATRAVLYQEIGEAEDRLDVLDSQPLGWQLPDVPFGDSSRKNNPVLIGLSPTLQVEDSGWTFISDFIPGGVNPVRGMTWAIVRIKGRLGLPPFVLCSIHMTNGAFGNPGQRAEQERIDRWNQGHQNISAQWREWHREGLTILGGGDLNRSRRRWPTGPNFMSGTHVLANHGLDWLLMSEHPKGARLAKAHAEKVVRGRENHTDHPFVGVCVHLRRP